MTQTVDLRRRDGRQDEGAGMLAQLKRVADYFHFTATRVGQPGCAVRLEAADNEAAVRWAISKLEGKS